ncbi:MAG: Fic family protein [Endomicrobium sp.]|jgi:Fic family protein|nr:Fic family protein [Endomicrobium sp.]
MQLPEKVNFNWQSVLQKALLDNTINIHEIAAENSEIAAELKNANDSYEYWDKAKYTVLPENISPELFWSILKFKRCGLYAEKIKLGLNIFKYLINPEILRKMAFVQTFNANMNLSLDEENEYFANTKMEEAIASSKLEGADVVRETAKEMLRANIPAANESEQTVICSYKALNFIEKHADEKLSVNFIKKIYSIVMNLNDTEVFRKDTQNVRVADIRDNEVLYKPPQATDIEMLLNSLCDYANMQTDADDIIKAAIIHFLFIYIHPFNAGNGKMARILFYWYAFKNGLNAFKYLTISKVLRMMPTQYAKAFLYVGIDEKDITYFINFTLDVCFEAINNFKNFLEKKNAADCTNVLINAEIKLNIRHQSIIRELSENQNARNIEYFKNKLGIVYETARKDLMYLAKKGFLTKRKKGKEFIYSLRKKLLKKLQKTQNPNS